MDLNNNNVTNNYVNKGGVIFSGDCAVRDIQNYYYKNNGQVIYQIFGSLVVNGSHFECNKSPTGSIIVLSKPTKSTFVTEALFHTNSGFSGSAISIQSSFPLYISDTTFFNNQASIAGAIFSFDSDTQGIVNCYFVQNDARIQGGAIYIFGDSIRNKQHLQLSNCYFYNNTGNAVTGFYITLMAVLSNTIMPP